ncbi:hypothetical protein ACROYT_G004723, partial [Oculina patagonica]
LSHLLFKLSHVKRLYSRKNQLNREMHVSPKRHFINPVFEDDIHKTTSVESLQLQKQIRNHTEDKPFNSGKANLAQGSNRSLLALVIVVCLISLVALLLTLLMLSGKLSSVNE